MLLRKLGIISGLASGLVLAMSFGGVVADSSKPDVSFGEAITEADIAAWDIDIETPTGKGLPAGSGSVTQGKALFDAQCVACHGADCNGKTAPYTRQYVSVRSDSVRLYSSCNADE